MAEYEQQADFDAASGADEEERERRAKPAPALRKVDPIGVRTAYGHINRGDKPHEWGPIQIADYPRSENGERLRAFRVERGLTLLEASKLLGLRPSELSGLERGSYDAEDWGAVFGAIAAKPGAGEEG